MSRGNAIKQICWIVVGASRACVIGPAFAHLSIIKPDYEFALWLIPDLLRILSLFIVFWVIFRLKSGVLPNAHF
jgi:hypothetical protein